jgi:small-conductance mechanosensitive channel
MIQQQLDLWIRGLVRWAGFVPNRDLSGWILLVLAVLAGLVTNLIVTQAVRFVLGRQGRHLTLRLLSRNVKWAFFTFVPSLFFLIGTNAQSNRFLQRHPTTERAAEVLFVIVSTWLALGLLKVGESLLVQNYDTTTDEDLSQRRLVTRIRFVRRGLSLVVVVLGFSIVLLSFKGGQKVGLSVLTSAGIVSVLVGFAAQRTLANLLAGIQIAFTQQIRLYDAVVVEKEWGRIEEINLTTVVVRLWDHRRMILPITYFIDTPFENWTRTESSLTGTVLLYVDYAVPVAALRQKAKDLVEADPLWDSQVFAVQVTDSQPTCMVVRVLASAANASAAFDLRCHLREALIAFLAAEFPGSLPKTRLTFADRD